MPTILDRDRGTAEMTGLSDLLQSCPGHARIAAALAAGCAEAWGVRIAAGGPTAEEIAAAEIRALRADLERPAH